MADPKHGQDPTDKSGRQMDRQGTRRETERQAGRDREPQRQGDGDTGTGREARRV